MAKDRFDILSKIILTGSKGRDTGEITEAALSLAADYVGLEAAAVYLWDDNLKVTSSVDYARSDVARRLMATIEEGLYSSLRREKKLASAYLSFEGDPEYHSFTLPLRFRGKVFGAVVGLQQGEKTMVAEDRFLETFTALMALNHAVSDAERSSDSTRELIDKERTAAVVETAVTVNHEINNPLTAILGNIQLLLLKHDDLDSGLRDKLKVVEESALKIRDVTQKLLRLTTPRSVPYSEGANMLDLSDDDEEKQS